MFDNLKRQALRKQLTELALSLGPLREQILSCGARYRLGDRMRAAEELIAAATTLAQVSVRVANVASVAAEGSLVAPLLKVHGHLAQLFDDISDAQEHRDTVRIADSLEYEAAPLLKRWQATLEGLRLE